MKRDNQLVAVLTNTSPGLAHAWHPVLPIGELHDKPVQIILLGEKWVIVRLDGEIKAFVDRCPHRNARLSDGKVIGQTIECPYHGWRYDNTGHCTLVPALGPGATLPPNAKLQPALVQVKYDLIWIAPEKPVCDILHVAEWFDESLRKVWLPPIVVNAGAAQFIDNFLDFSHFPFVHTGTFGTNQDVLVEEYEVERGDWSFVVNIEHTIANKEDPKVVTGEHPLVQPRIMRYEYQAPFNANLRLELPMTGMVNAIAVFCQPIDYNQSCLYMVMLRNDVTTDEQHRDAVQYEIDIFAEDRKIIEYLYNTEVPLERGQAHTRVDRNTVEFRRIIAKLLATS